jgi:hypothetical protein
MRLVGSLRLRIKPPQTTMAPGSGMKISDALDFIGECLMCFRDSDGVKNRPLRA